MGYSFFDDLDDPIAQAARLAADPSAQQGAPGMTPQSFAGALGPNNVTGGPQVAPPAPPPMSLLPSPDSASQPGAGSLLDASGVGNAGVPSVPQFQAPDNPATPIHHSFLGNVASKLGSLYNTFATNTAGLSSAQMAMMSPADIARAKSVAMQGFFDRAAHKQLDSRGFQESRWSALAGGNMAGLQAGQQYAGTALQAQQEATQVAQQRALVQGRAALAQQYGFSPQDTQNEQLRKLDGLAAGLVGLGDYHGATAAAAAAKSLREGTGANMGSQNKRLVDLGDRYVWADPVTKQVTELNGAPVTDGTKKETAFHAAETWAARNTASLNASTHRESAFQTQFVKPFSKVATSFANWDSVKQQALPSAENPQGNPAATKAAITAFVGAMEPNVQLRYATLQYLSQVDPSLAGSIKRMISTGQYGTLPPQQLAEMDQVVQAKQATFKKQYGTTLARGLQQYPELATKAPSWEDLTGASANGAETPEPVANPFR